MTTREIADRVASDRQITRTRRGRLEPASAADRPDVPVFVAIVPEVPDPAGAPPVDPWCPRFGPVERLHRRWTP